MPGVKGAGGPPPKRDKLRRRRNDPVGGPAETGFGAAVVPVPPAKRSWAPAAKRWYESLARSGQAQWYEPSDWAMAWFMAESMSRDLRPKFVGTNKQGKPVMVSMPINGSSMAAYLKGMTALLVTEGDRRRARVELERPDVGDDGEETGGDVAWLDTARDRRAGSS